MTSPGDFSATKALLGGAPQKPQLNPAHVADGPPHPALQAIGFNSGIGAFNRRVQIIHDVYTKWSGGLRPDPGVVFDVARAPLADDQIPKLFDGLPRSQLEARALQAIRTHPPRSPAFVVKGAVDAYRNGHDAYLAYLDDNDAALTAALKDPKLAGQYQRALADVHLEQNPHLYGRSPGYTVVYDEHGKLKQSTAGVLTDLPKPGIVGKLLFGIAEGFPTFIGGAVIGPAALALAEYRGVHQSIRERSPRPLGETQATLAKGVVAGLAHDVRHPVDNAAFLTADVFAALTAGGGVTSRIAAATRAEGVGGKAAALVKRPAAGTVAVQKGGYTEHELAFENPLARGVQSMIADARNRNLERRFSGAAPAGTAWVSPRAVFDSLVDLLPGEAKMNQVGARPPSR
jgi:hypothetical protein